MTKVYDNEALLAVLTEMGVVDPVGLKVAYEQSQRENRMLGEVLLDRDLISDENLGRIVAELLKLPLVRLSTVAIPDEILKIVPEVVARKQKMIVFGRDEKGLKLAMATPGNAEVRDFVARKTGEPVEVFYATLRDVEGAMGLYKRDLQRSFNELLKEQIDVVAASKPGRPVDAPVSKILNLLVVYSLANRASDIHIEPGKKASVVRFRIDGVLHDVLELPRALHEQLVSKIKVASRLRTDEHLAAQDGKMQAEMGEDELDIRVSIVPLVHGEKVVLRLLSSGSRRLSMGDLGMSGGDLAKLETGFNRPFGMVLSTGPTGCGKTTTIYSVLKILNIRGVNIASIEDPVEYDIEGVNQIQVNPKTNLTFASGLRAILRQDPNIIFVGEIRDAETAGIAVNSAMTGHLVLSTLHTNDAATTLPRLIEMGVEPFLVASTVNLIVGQRLVRRICEKCRVSQEIEGEAAVKYLGEPRVRVYVGKGCEVCQQTGYLGRVGVFEVLVLSEGIKDLIVAKADAGAIKRRAQEEGMSTMLEDGLKKVRQGITSLDEIIRVTKE